MILTFVLIVSSNLYYNGVILTYYTQKKFIGAAAYLFLRRLGSNHTPPVAFGLPYLPTFAHI